MSPICSPLATGEACPSWLGSAAYAGTVGAIVLPSCSAIPGHALLPTVMRLLEKVEELSRRLQRLSRQGLLDDIPPALLAGAQGEAA